MTKLQKHAFWYLRRPLPALLVAGLTSARVDIAGSALDTSLESG